MKISFVVTYYNQEAYVRQSLDSILAVEKPCDWEILVGDDGSSDGTCRIVESYIRQYPDRISLYVMPRESGVKYDPVHRASANRLNLIEHSTGDVFCLLDGDDFYCDTAFVRDAVPVLEAHPEVSVVAFGFRYYQDGVMGYPITLRPGLTNRAYLESWYIPAGGCVMRKNWGEERIRFLKRLGAFDDNDILVNCLQYGELREISRAIYAYRQTGSSVYNSMDAVQKAILNVEGYDQNRMLMDESYHDVLLRRYAMPILIMYANRKKLRQILGNEKFDRILEETGLWNDSLCGQIMSGQKVDAGLLRTAALSLLNTLPRKVLRRLGQKLGG